MPERSRLNQGSNSQPPGHELDTLTTEPSGQGKSKIRLYVLCILILSHSLTLYHTIPTFNDLEKEPIENIVEKGENAGKKHFPLFPTIFLPFPNQILIFHSLLIFNLQMLSV